MAEGDALGSTCKPFWTALSPLKPLLDGWLPTSKHMGLLCYTYIISFRPAHNRQHSDRHQAKSKQTKKLKQINKVPSADCQQRPESIKDVRRSNRCQKISWLSLTVSCSYKTGRQGNTGWACLSKRGFWLVSSETLTLGTQQERMACLSLVLLSDGSRPWCEREAVTRVVALKEEGAPREKAVAVRQCSSRWSLEHSSFDNRSFFFPVWREFAFLTQSTGNALRRQCCQSQKTG